MSVRKAHNNGRNHLRNVIDYYQRTSARPSLHHFFLSFPFLFAIIVNNRLTMYTRVCV